MTQTPRSIEEILLETDLPDRALRKGVRRALLRHKLLGQPIAVSRNGEVVWIPADEIDVPPYEDAEECGGGIMLPFERFVGIDYSGAGAPDQIADGLAVVAVEGTREPERVENPAPRRKRWSRQDLATWLEEILSEASRTLVGIDHAFSPPLGENWADRTWDAVLRDCTARWRTHECSVANAKKDWQADLERAGQPA